MIAWGQALAAWPTRFADRRLYPIAPKPISSIAQLDGSGAADTIAVPPAPPQTLAAQMLTKPSVVPVIDVPPNVTVGSPFGARVL